MARGVLRRAAVRRLPVAAAVLAVLQAAPAAAATGAPSGLTSPSPTAARPSLSWAPPTSVGAGILGYTVYRRATGATTAWTKLTTSPITTRAYTDMALATNGSWSYVVRAVETGSGTESTDSNVADVLWDNLPPPAPTTPVAATPTPTVPVLGWTSGGPDALSGFDHYEVSRGTTVVGASLAATTFTDSGLSVSGSYAYSIRAVDAAGNRSAALAKAVVYDAVAPDAPGGFNPAPAQRSQPALAWTAATDTGGAGIDHYEVFRGTRLIGTTTTTSFVDTAITAEATYDYHVLAVDKAGNVGPPTATRTVSYDATAPVLPTTLTASAGVTKDKPAVGWSAGTDAGSGIVAYRVYRGTTAIGQTPGLVYSDTALVVDGAYSYRVTALDAAGNESSATAAVTITYDKTAPPVPTNLTGPTPTAATPVISFTSGGPDALSGLDHFEVYRGAVLAGTLPAGGPTTFTDSGVPSSGSQSYTVRSVDVAGNLSVASAARVIVYDTVAPPTPGNATAPAATRVAPVISWAPAVDTGGSGLDHYAVYRGGALLGTSTTTSYTDASAPPNATYVYSVSAVDRASNEGARTATLTVVYDTTAPGPPARPSGLAVTRVKPALSWAAAADTGGSGIASYTVLRGAATAGTSTTTGFTDAALTTNGTYAYSVRATDAAGNVGPASPTLDVTYDSIAPPAPTGLLAPSVTGAAPRLSWSSGGADSGTGFDRYAVYRGTTLIGTTTSTTYDDTTLTAAGTVVYTVRALDVAGNESASSNSRQVVYDPTPPAAPGGLDAATPTPLPVLRWTAPLDAGGIARYEIYRNGSTTPIGTSTTTTYTDGSITTDGTYVYTVRAVDGAGNAGSASAGRSVLVDVTPPPGPSWPSADPLLTGSKPALSWASGGPDATSGFAKYVLLRNGVKIAEPASSSYVDVGLAVGGTYSYAVKAVDLAGNESPLSSPLQVTYDTAPPAVPVNVSVAASRTAGAPQLSWASGGGDPGGGSGFDHYDVYRGPTLVGRTAATSLTDTTVGLDGSYGYTVRAVDRVGNASAASAPVVTVLVDTTPPAVPAGVTAASPTNGAPRLTWTATLDGPGSGVVGYLVYRDGSTTPLTPLPIATAAFTDADTTADGVHTYEVVAVDGVGNRSPRSASVTVQIDTVPPTPPGALRATTPTNRPALSWTPATDSESGNTAVVAYVVYRGAVRVGSTSLTTFSDDSVTLNETYPYTVRAIDGAGNESAPSDPVSVVFDTVAPRPPSLAVPVSPSRARPVLSWTSGGNDERSGLERYEILRDGAVVGTLPTVDDDPRAVLEFGDDRLPANGAYRYTVRAVDAAGNRSSPSEVRTAVWDDTAPPAPSSVTPVATPTNLPSFRWADVLDLGGSGLARYRVSRDNVLLPDVGTTTGAYVDAAPDDADRRRVDPALAEGAHTYRFLAVDGAGNTSGPSETVLVEVDLTPPTAPAFLEQKGFRDGPVPTRAPVITWGPALDPVGTPGASPSRVNHYDVLRRPSPREGSTPGVLQRVGSVAGLEFADEALTQDGTYDYVVRAVDGAGNVSAATPVLTIAFDHSAPPAPARLSGRSPSPDLPLLRWTTGGADRGPAGFDHYDVYRDGVLIADAGTPTWLDGGLSSQGPHDYVVRAVDRAGNVSAPSAAVTVVYDTTPPPVPPALSVASPTNLPHLTWDAIGDDDTGASGVDHYVVYRDGAVVGRPSVTTFDDGSVPLDGSYGYAVAAVDRAGNQSLRSRTIAVRFDGSPPPAPEGLSAASPTRLPLLAWSAASDARSGGSAVAGYRVFRDGLFLAETAGTSFADSRVTGSGTYTYTVLAVDAAGNVGPMSASRAVAVDGEGPLLDGVSFPTQRATGVPVPFVVHPTDTLSGVNGQAVWDFGDGSAGGNAVSHVYHEPGTYQVTVRATDNLGNVTSLAAHVITITGRSVPVPRPPTATLTVAAMPTVRVKALRAARWRLRLPVVLGTPLQVQVVVRRNGRVVVSTSRRLAAGRRTLTLALPRAGRSAGRFSVLVRAPAAGLQATRSFTVRR